MTVALADAVRQALPNIKSGSLAVFGDIFGGRIDNIHHVIGAAVDEDGSTTVEFDAGETLTVWDADGVSITGCSRTHPTHAIIAQRGQAFY